MSEIISQIIIYLILATLIGWVVGYLTGRASCDKTSSCNEKPKSTHELHINQRESKGEESISIDNVTNKPKEIGKKPALLSKPREGKKDDFLLIKGIGKVSEKLLNDIGIYHFDQIANLTKEEVIWLNNSIAVFPGKIEREDWVSQAKELAQNSK